MYFQYWVTRGQTKTPHFWRLEFFSTGAVLKKFPASIVKTEFLTILSCYRWHNVLAGRIKSRYPNWSDENVFQASQIKLVTVHTNLCFTNFSIRARFSGKKRSPIYCSLNRDFSLFQTDLCTICFSPKFYKKSPFGHCIHIH